MSGRIPLVLAAALAGSLLLPQVCRGQGATVPFVTFEAEAGSRSGGATLHQLSGTITGTTASPEFEASGRAYVRLDANGETVTWTNSVNNANRITVRFCVPDNGANNSLSLRIAGSHRMNIQLNSKYAWLYGNAGENGQSNSSGSGSAHVFWDDLRVSVSGNAITSGQSIALRKDTGQGNNASYYYIDLIDVEASAGVGSPSNHLNVTQAPYNVVVNDGGDDRSKIQQAINDANNANPKKAVWLPSGVYNLSGPLDVKGVLVQGAGHWNTRIIITSKVRVFTLNNTGAKVRHIGIFNEISSPSRSNTDYAIQGVWGTTEQWNVEDCWIQHTGTGLWMSDSDNGSARRNRVYNTYADGINLNRGSHGNILEHNYVRGVGDDSIAVISEQVTNGQTNPVGTNNTVRYNTLVAPWWGVIMSFRGGSGHVFQNNKLQDSTYGAGLGINLESAYNMYSITGGSFSNNQIIRGGGPKGTQQRGAIWVHAGNQNISGLSFSSTTITNPIFNGVWINGNTGQSINFTATNTTISMNNNGHAGVKASHGLSGTGTFTNGSITGTSTKFQDDAGSFNLTHSGF